MAGYEPPSWAGNPKAGLHLDVVKNETVLQKLLIDEKSYYLFGRNNDVCDFTLHHQSCSRVHAALVHHKHLNRPFLVDFGSAHGTYVGSLRLDPHKPQQLLLDSTFRFGASTRAYTLREKPQQSISLVANDDGDEGSHDSSGLLLGINDTDEVDDLTQYNTAQNRKITTLGIVDEPTHRRHKFRNVKFSDVEEIINPEDIDSSIGKFRNMVQSSVIPKKKPRLEAEEVSVQTSKEAKPFTQPLSSPTALMPSLPQTAGTPTSSRSSTFLPRTVSAAPPVADPSVNTQATPFSTTDQASWTLSLFNEQDIGNRKKKYAKESWPGKKPSLY